MLVRALNNTLVDAIILVDVGRVAPAQTHPLQTETRMLLRNWGLRGNMGKLMSSWTLNPLLTVSNCLRELRRNVGSKMLLMSFAVFPNVCCAHSLASAIVSA